MKTLKLALLVTSAAGAVAAGGVTYATVGNSTPAPSVQSAKDAVAKHLPATNVPSVPAAPSVPTCLPNLPKGQALEAAKAKVEQQIKELAAKAPQTPVTLPAAPGKTPKVLPAAKLAKLPVDKLPTCRADAEQSKPVKAPKLPAKPELPAAVSCDSVPQVIKNEEARSKDLALPNGLHVAGVDHTHSIVIHSRAACVYTQEFVGAAKQLVTVDRITTPPQVTLQDLAGSLKMAGGFVQASGVEAWRTPAGDGMLWYSKDGYAVRVTGAGPAALLVPGIATQLQTQ
jgi:hypothetical protein